jgi:enamine deaminase RidA (YjgF/YER057c/UK114 family)
MKKKISLISSENLAAVDYPYASRVPSDKDILFLAGACPLNKEGEISELEDYEKQARICVENLKEALKGCGASIKDVVYTRILVATLNRSDLVTVWKTVREELGEVNVPSTLSGVTVLGYENQLVEIEAVAAVEESSLD